MDICFFLIVYLLNCIVFMFFMNIEEKFSFFFSGLKGFWKFEKYFGIDFNIKFSNSMFFLYLF